MEADPMPLKCDTGFEGMSNTACGQSGSIKTSFEVVVSVATMDSSESHDNAETIEAVT